MSVTIGPLSLPTGPLLVLLTVVGASWTAGTLARRQGLDTPARLGDAVFTLAWLTLVGARLGHVVLHAETYAEHPWLVADIRDGGWHLGSGLLAGTLALLRHTRRHPERTKVLAPVVLASASLLLGAGALLDRLTPDRLPPLSLRTPGSTTATDLARDVVGQPTVVVLWASWCGVCRQEWPLWREAAARYPAVRFVHVNQGEDEPTVTQAVREWALPIPQVRLDPSSSLGQALGTHGLPTTLFLDARGQRVHVHPGLLTTAGLNVRIREICPDC